MRAVDTVITNVRVFPLISVSEEQLEELVGSKLVTVEPVVGGLTNTIHKVTLENGDVLGIKHYAGGREWFETELSTLTLLHGTLPVPEVLHADEQKLVIVYRWIDGITLHDLRKQGHHEAFLTLGEPLGRVLWWLAKSDATEPFELTEVLEQSYARLTNGTARDRLGEQLADSLRRAMEAAEPDMAWGAVCLSHGDLGHRNVLVYQAGDRWRINGIIDWETTTTGSPLVDIGSLFRYSKRYDTAFCAHFERGYKDAGGTLPEHWLRAARLLDATWLVDMVADEQGQPLVVADCAKLISTLVADVTR